MLLISVLVIHYYFLSVYDIDSIVGDTAHLLSVKVVDMLCRHACFRVLNIVGIYLQAVRSTGSTHNFVH